MKSSEYSDLKTFKVVAELESFAGAARKLRMTPSAVSQIINRLEKHLNVRLLNRTTRSVSLTTEGTELFKRIEPALVEIESAVTELKSNASTPIGCVKIHSTSTAARDLLTPLIGEFSLRFPDIILDIIVEDTAIDIISQGFDVGLSLGEFVQKDMIAYPLAPPTKLVAAASPEYLKKHDMPQTPNDLRHHQCLNWRFLGDKSIYRWEFYVDGHWLSYGVDGPLVSTSRDLLLSSALKGVGIILWEERILQPWFQSGELIPLLKDYCRPYLSSHLYYPRQNHTSKRVRTFIDFMKEKYRVS